MRQNKTFLQKLFPKVFVSVIKLPRKGRRGCSNPVHQYSWIVALTLQPSQCFMRKLILPRVTRDIPTDVPPLLASGVLHQEPEEVSNQLPFLSVQWGGACNRGGQGLFPPTALICLYHVTSLSLRSSGTRLQEKLPQTLLSEHESGLLNEGTGSLKWI